VRASCPLDMYLITPGSAVLPSGFRAFRSIWSIKPHLQEWGISLVLGTNVLYAG
jgi:hypothetical protein